ncbi:MAG: hypothetical protein AAFX87_13995 [Bacteroidota bacterium]
MLHLITIVGKSAKDFYLEQKCIPDFKSLIRAITSGREMIVSTRFRSDLFYSAEKQKTSSILKLWALYAKMSLSDLDENHLVLSSGDEKSLSRYFQSMNQLSASWYYYKRYRSAFRKTFSNDQQNLVARTVVQCDQYLVKNTNIDRVPIIDFDEQIHPRLTTDTLSIAMHIINNDTLSN